MSKLELFAETGLKGDTISLSEDADLSAHGFDKKARSMRITGDPWVLYTDIKYGGKFYVYTAGDYSSIPNLDNKLCSVRIVVGGLSNPKITVYGQAYYKGNMASITVPSPSLSKDLDNMISSHKVQSGCWVLYAQQNYKGIQMIALAGDNVPSYVPLHWEDPVRSLRPAKPEHQYMPDLQVEAP